MASAKPRPDLSKKPNSYSVHVAGGAVYVTPATHWKDYWVGQNILCRFYTADGTEVSAFINPLAIIPNFLPEEPADES